MTELPPSELKKVVKDVFKLLSDDDKEACKDKASMTLSAFEEMDANKGRNTIALLNQMLNSLLRFLVLLDIWISQCNVQQSYWIAPKGRESDGGRVPERHQVQREDDVAAHAQSGGDIWLWQQMRLNVLEEYTELKSAKWWESIRKYI